MRLSSNYSLIQASGRREGLKKVSHKKSHMKVLEILQKSIIRNANIEKVISSGKENRYKFHLIHIFDFYRRKLDETHKIINNI